MKRNTTKGFTLIELLAVIVILAIIALIAVPIILNIIDKANKSAFKDTAYGIISAGELYFAEQQLEVNGMTESKTFNLPDTTNTLGLKGNVPEGYITITRGGDIELKVKNDRYCATKGFNDKDVTVTEDPNNCNLPSGGSGNQENSGSGEKTLTSLAVDNFTVSNVDGSNPTVVTKPACLIDGTECIVGTPVAVKVNDSNTYRFYVLNDENNKVTLIMDRNLGDNVKWYFVQDNGSGPQTALNALTERTNEWTNIIEREYTYTDDGIDEVTGETNYASFRKTMRARLITYTESSGIRNANNYVAPEWLYINLYGTGDDSAWGYWTSAACTTSDGDPNAYLVDNTGYTGDDNPDSDEIGIRPVIELSK